MKKLIVLLLIALVGIMAPLEKVNAQDPISEVIKAGIEKVIKAVDLKIQRLQNQTIWLQNAQKVVENTMSKLKLTEISDWVEKQRTLYADYYDELSKVKSLISYYHRIKEITNKQLALISEYKRSYRLFKQDDHFNPTEIAYIGTVYAGIIDQSVKNLDHLFLVINSFATQMTDAKRLEIINGVADEMDKCYADLKAFNNENVLLSLQRSKEKNDVDRVKNLYGL